MTDAELQNVWDDCLKRSNKIIQGLDADKVRKSLEDPAPEGSLQTEIARSPVRDPNKHLI